MVRPKVGGAVAAQPLSSPRSPGDLARLPGYVAFARFVHDIFAVETVQKIKYCMDGGGIDLWVLTREEVLSDAERIYDLEGDYLSSPDALPIEVHVVPLSQVRERNLPAARMLFER